eukprot:CAMPEP_0172878410 /NCGR_PEP_ID=MMETSP1075-20121228/109619_1 /TAXON_ID=2916 /ORGANISM="Ceratium fusus, Strain PA161109" /LENGTH=162 /DNA_ID=CAMNT_0013730189 /DNA_START=14 /DNA_END=499 /DNA_ORIENTATION=-
MAATLAKSPSNNDLRKQAVNNTIKGMPDYKPVFAKAQGADEQRCQEAESELMELLKQTQKKTQRGLCCACIFCPCTLGCSCCCCPLIFVSGIAPKMMEWSEKYPLIAVELNKNGPVVLENGNTVKLEVPPPSIEAINRRRAELGLAVVEEKDVYCVQGVAAP